MGPLSILFHRVFRVMSNKESSVKECYIVEGSSIIWDVSFRKSLRQNKEFEYESLLCFLSNIFL